MNATPDLVIANLDAEISWARRRGHDVRDLPDPVLRRVSLYGTLLRVLWPRPTRLWTPAPVDPRCVRPVPELPDVELVSGALRPDDAAAAGAWAFAPPWNGADERIDVAAYLNHRAFAHETAVRLGLAFPGSAIVRSMAEIEAQVARCPRFVLKTPFGAAGRGFVRGEDGRFVDPNGAARVARLLAAHGELLFEPWMRRRYDVGRAVWPGYRDARTHALLNAPGGQLAGIAVGSGWIPATLPHEIDQLAELSVTLAEAFEAAGYHGPFGIDAFVYDEDRVQLLCEINARFTFGHVAHALRDRVAVPRWGDVPVLVAFGERAEKAGPDVVPLVGSADGERMYAWMRRGQ